MKKFTYTLFIVMVLASLVVPAVFAEDFDHVQPRILAGQDQFVGTVLIHGDSESLELFFSFRAGWCMTESHVHVGDSLDDFPQNKGGAIPGQFDYKTDHEGCVTSFTMEIPSDGLYGNYTMIAIHTVVIGPDGQEETGWTVNCGNLEAGQFPGRNWSAFAQFPANMWQ